MHVVVGRIGRPHGLGGDVTIEVRTDDPDRRLAVGTTLTTEPASAGPLRIEAVRSSAGRVWLHFVGIDDRNAAEALRDALLVADVDPLERPDDPEEFYDHQLTGLSVRNAEGEHIGTIEDVLHLPGQDVLSVRQTDAAEVLVPFVAAIVPTVDLAGGFVVITPPPGLLGADAADPDADEADS